MPQRGSVNKNKDISNDNDPFAYSLLKKKVTELKGLAKEQISEFDCVKALKDAITVRIVKFCESLSPKKPLGLSGKTGLVPTCTTNDVNTFLTENEFKVEQLSSVLNTLMGMALGHVIA